MKHKLVSNVEPGIAHKTEIQYSYTSQATPRRQTRTSGSDLHEHVEHVFINTKASED